MFKKVCENAEAEQYVSPRRVKKRMQNSFTSILPRAENFTPIKTSGVSSAPGGFFFSSLVVKTIRASTTHSVEFIPGVKVAPGQTFDCKQAQDQN